MPRLMSVAMTTDAVIERRKTVTRRKGWWVDKNGRRLLHAGDRLTLCRKVQGRKPGEPLERLAEVEVVDVRREVLVEAHRTEYDEEGWPVWPEIVAEGFPDMTPGEFIDQFFVEAQGIAVTDDVTRIEWRYLDQCCWRDNQGDIWHDGADGLMHTRETAPFPREHVERKWGPLVLVPDPIHNESREGC